MISLLLLIIKVIHRSYKNSCNTEFHSKSLLYNPFWFFQFVCVGVLLYVKPFEQCHLELNQYKQLLGLTLLFSNIAVPAVEIASQ